MYETLQKNLKKKQDAAKNAMDQNSTIMYLR